MFVRVYRDLISALSEVSASLKKCWTVRGAGCSGWDTTGLDCEGLGGVGGGTLPAWTVRGSGGGGGWGGGHYRLGL